MNYVRNKEPGLHCRDLLALAMGLGPDEASPDEEAMLGRLATGTEAGQRRLAGLLERTAKLNRAGPEGRVSEDGPSQSPGRRPGRRWWWPAIPGTLAVAAAVVAAAVLLRQRRPSDGEMIALAYDRHRVTELRIPGTHAVVLASPTRGAGVEGDWSELLEIKLRAQRAFERNPNDSQVRITLGEIALVEHDGETARRQFEMAEALRAGTGQLRFDEASAYFELAELNGHALDYARAIDLFGQHLEAVHGKDAVALFDRGLCWEREAVNAEAIRDFEAALALEKDAGWRAEIERHLARLKARTSLRGPPAGVPSTRAGVGEQGGGAVALETPGQYEGALDLAGREELPRRGADARADGELQQLAVQGKMHGDAWLGEMLQYAPSEAEKVLGEALRSSARGDADAAGGRSLAAAGLFRRGGNKAGRLRAAAEHVYSLQRLGRAGECLQEGNALLGGLPIRRYAPLRVYVKLEVASCHGLQGENGAGTRLTLEAMEEARGAQLPMAGLRAAGFLVNAEAISGELEPAWRLAAESLEGSYALDGTAMRRYGLLEGMEGIARTLGLRSTEAGLAEAAADEALRTGNLQVEAYALESLGGAELRTGAKERAEATFQAADWMLGRLGGGEMPALYRANWEMDRTRLRVEREGAEAALRTFAADEPRFAALKAFYSQLRFYNEYAELLLRTGDAKGALDKARLAVADAESLLPEIRSNDRRAAWGEQTAGSYGVLVATLAELGRGDEALQAWELFRSAPRRGGGESAGRLRGDRAGDRAGDRVGDRVGDGASEMQALPQVSRLTLVLARVQQPDGRDGLLAWAVIPDGRVITRHLRADPEAVAAEGRAFRRLCADPHSAPEDLRLLGESLFRDLLQPLADTLAGDAPVQLDLDPSLEPIPLAAVPQDGRAFGLRHALTFLPAGWALSRSALDDVLPPDPRLVVLRQAAPGRSGAAIPEEYDESAEIGRRFARVTVEPISLRRSSAGLELNGGRRLAGALGSSDVVHYVGHGLLEDDRGGEAAGGSPFALAPGALRHCKLAVLAACRTLRQGESGRESEAGDVPSFTRILLQAGAGYVVATQWDVDSRMTQRLMARFYAELAGHHSFADALRVAQESLAMDSVAAHPYYWSAFQLVGQSAARPEETPRCPSRDVAFCATSAQSQHFSRSPP